MKLSKTKLSLVAAFLLANQAFAQSVPHVIVTAKPDIAEIEIDKFSSTSAVVTDDTILDLHAADLASALRNTPGTVYLGRALKVRSNFYISWALTNRNRNQHLIKKGGFRRL
jgi:hypothetical protein